MQEQCKLERVDSEAFRKSAADWVKYIREYCPNREAIIILALNWAYNDNVSLYCTPKTTNCYTGIIRT